MENKEKTLKEIIRKEFEEKFPYEDFMKITTEPKDSHSYIYNSIRKSYVRREYDKRK